ncbi:hypothetical protein [Janibacter sp. G368]|uniref:hypothetical protein n=1 Tax=Janibacter sp. G368 TaxID=3420441 RepID=UPI003CFC8049
MSLASPFATAVLVGDVLDGALVVDVLDEVVLGDVVLEDVGRSTGAVTVLGCCATWVPQPARVAPASNATSAARA